ncbi:hypothetical protein HDU85_002089 [Gaertneriomyces sp. JEL0708]|nr:hypothetical protein HDU85_002089 [Gaertneriomyces sp. JEL0708]
MSSKHGSITRALSRFSSVKHRLLPKFAPSSLPKGSDPSVTNSIRIPDINQAENSMADIQFTPRQAPKRTWNFFSWTPTSPSLAQEAEARLLSRMIYFRRDDATEKESHSHEMIARVGLVDLGEGRMINTLVIDRISESERTVLHSGEDQAGVHQKFTMSENSSKSDSNGSIEMDFTGNTDNISTRSLKSSTSSLRLEQDVAPVEDLETKLPHKDVLVMCHGYGAGLGFFYRNYAGLSQSLSHDYRIYALDWLGMANSSRPSFPRIPRNASDKDIVDTAEEFFVSSLEKWREKMRIEKMTLMGHSLGGYLATAYTEKHPERVSKLILVSPAGVSEPPPEALSLQQTRQLPLLYRFFRHLWTQNITPMSLVRVTGPYGPTLVSKYTARRFAHLPTLDSTDLHSYIYHISAQRGSGEYALSHLLLPGAWARIPLPSRLRKLTVPTSFVYGDSDWMDYRAAVKVVKEEGGMRPEAAPRIVRVKSAGHHLYLDNPEGFNDALVAEVKGVPDRESELIEYVHT